MPTTAEFCIDMLQRSGVKHVFGLSGDYNLSFFNKLYKSKIEVVPTTSELTAGFAADAYARVNGIGCVCVTYCVGGFRLIDAVAQAYAERSPVIVISGSPGIKERKQKLLLHHMVGHFECQHRMFEHITCANTVLRDTDRAGYEIDRVLTAVNHYKQPGYIEIPRDIIDKPIRYDAYTLGTPKEPASDENNLAEALAEVSAWIASSKNPVIWAGVEVARFGLGKQLVKFAEAANIPIATTILGKSVINEKHPLSLGVYCESIASPELKGIIDNCDCLIALGVMMTDVNLGFLPLKFQRKNSIFAAFSTLDVKNHSYQDVNFADFVNGLSKVKLPRKEYTNTITRKEIKFEATKDKTITCSRVFEKINSVLNENTVVIADVGNALFGSLDIAVHDSHNFLSNAFYASMGFSIAGALGVQTAKPHLRPIVIMGDGAFQMTGMEFSTLVKRKLNPIIIVLNNGGYGTERLILDGPYNDLHNWNYEKIPLLMGGIGFLVNTEEELDNAFNQALPLKNQPVIINIKLDPKDQVRSIKKVFRKE